MSKGVAQGDSDWLFIESTFSNYSLKVPIKVEGEKVYIDVESAINSDQHYIQTASNFYKGLIASNVTQSYNVSSYQLLGILATAAKVEINPMTSDAGIFTDSWGMISLWLEMSCHSLNDVLYSFKDKYPDCQKIILTTSNPEETSVNISDNNYRIIEGLEQLPINGAVIDLTDIDLA